jgi:hypothetical protein
MEHNPYESPQAHGDAGKVNRSSVRAVLVTCLYLLFAFSGVVQATRPGSAILSLIISLAIASTASYWCVVDSRNRGRPILHSLQAIILFTWPVAVPLYLAYSRGIRGLGIAVAHAIGLLITNGIATCLAEYVKYGNHWLTQ